MKTKDILLMTFFTLILTSCSSDFLDIPPYGVNDESTLTTKSGVNKLLIGAYATLDGQASNDAYVWDNYWCTDDARFGSNMGINNLEAFVDVTPLSDNLAQRWRTLYGMVLRSNDVLSVLPNVDDMTEQEKNEVAAQARFIRGFNYLKLAIIWKNVPWIDENVQYGDRSYLVSNDVDIYPYIEDDFKFAADNLPETWSEVGRVNKWAAKAFLAKTYMFQKKFTEAKQVLDDVVANGKTTNGLKYALLPKYEDNFRTATKHGSEAVFAVQMSVYDGSNNGVNGNPMSFQNGTYGGPANNGFGWYQPTFDLVDAFQVDEETGLPLLDTYYEHPIKTDYGLSSTDKFDIYDGPMDPRLDWCVGRRGIPYLDWGNHIGKGWVRNQDNGGPYSSIKHAAEKARVSTDRQATNRTNTPYNACRFADVILWAAECEVEVGSLDKAEEYINQIRQRAANPEGFVKKYENGAFKNEPAANYKVGLYPKGTFAAKGKSYARKAVRFERRLELAMEFHRYYDLVRYDGNDFDLSKYINEFLKREGNRLYLSPNNLYLQGNFIKGTHEISPIPQTEIDRSKGADGVSVLKQNPGY
ncbi:MAG: RagB/SusD family nutrient uptake outer membrane protein [Fermentimonas sp.]|jgi:hypothetical protein